VTAWLIARRLLVSALMMLVLSAVVFTVLRVIPGDPTAARAGDTGVTPEQIAQVREDLGLDEPIPVQYLRWIGGVVRGDFGASYFSSYSATSLVTQRIGATVELVAAAIVLGIALAVPLALVSALRPRSHPDRAIAVGATVGISIPPFCFGLLLLAIFAVQLEWLPTRGYVSLAEDPIRNLQLLILPATTLAIAVAAPLIRYLRAALLEELRTDYVRAARAKGLSRGAVVLRHALPNGLLPTLNVLGVIVATLLGGAVVIEYVFGWPGLGAMALESVQTRDYPVLQAVIMLAAAAFILTTLVVDIISYVIDPRLRIEGSR
jgi:peptide/nickel transport system permease protein